MMTHCGFDMTLLGLMKLREEQILSGYREQLRAVRVEAAQLIITNLLIEQSKINSDGPQHLATCPDCNGISNATPFANDTITYSSGGNYRRCERVAPTASTNGSSTHSHDVMRDLVSRAVSYELHTLDEPLHFSRVPDQTVREYFTKLARDWNVNCSPSETSATDRQFSLGEVCTLASHANMMLTSGRVTNPYDVLGQLKRGLNQFARSGFGESNQQQVIDLGTINSNYTNNSRCQNTMRHESLAELYTRAHQNFWSLAIDINKLQEDNLDAGSQRDIKKELTKMAICNWFVAQQEKFGWQTRHIEPLRYE